MMMIKVTALMGFFATKLSLMVDHCNTSCGGGVTGIIESMYPGFVLKNCSRFCNKTWYGKCIVVSCQSIRLKIGLLFLWSELQWWIIESKCQK